MAPRPRTLDAEPLPESDRIGDLPHPRDQYELFGHEDAAATLAAAARSNRLAHAWIIGGPKGVGKATLAWRLARAFGAWCAELPRRPERSGRPSGGTPHRFAGACRHHVDPQALGSGTQTP